MPSIFLEFHLWEWILENKNSKHELKTRSFCKTTSSKDAFIHHISIYRSKVALLRSIRRLGENVLAKATNTLLSARITYHIKVCQTFA